VVVSWWCGRAAARSGEIPPVDFFTDEVPSEVGLIVIAARDERLVSLDFGDCRGRMLAGLAARYGHARLKPVRNPFGVSRRINAYLAGDLGAVDDILVEPGGSPFQRDVWMALRRVPAGTTVTYAQLARAVGRPAAWRAVGAANGRNPVSIVIPCHRMIGSDGSLTGYGGGLHRKRWLLGHEGAICGSTDVDACAGARRPLDARPV
jgi:methylated-DNA-[protein]-cysteine S-methyltransferase